MCPGSQTPQKNPARRSMLFELLILARCQRWQGTEEGKSHHHLPPPCTCLLGKAHTKIPKDQTGSGPPCIRTRQQTLLVGWIWRLPDMGFLHLCHCKRNLPGIQCNSPRPQRGPADTSSRQPIWMPDATWTCRPDSWSKGCSQPRPYRLPWGMLHKFLAEHQSQILDHIRTRKGSLAECLQSPEGRSTKQSRWHLPPRQDKLKATLSPVACWLAVMLNKCYQAAATAATTCRSCYGFLSKTHAKCQPLPTLCRPVQCLSRMGSLSRRGSQQPSKSR